MFTAAAGVVVMDLGRRPEILSGHVFFCRKLTPEGLLSRYTFRYIHIQVFTHHNYFACPAHCFMKMPNDEIQSWNTLVTLLILAVTDLVRLYYTYLCCW